MWLALCASLCFLDRASEMSAETRSRIHESYCLRRADVAFCRGDFQLVEALWSTSDRVEVRFARHRVIRCERRLLLCTCGRVLLGPWAPGVAPSMPVSSSCLVISSKWLAPLVTFGVDNGRRSMWTQQHATAALRAVVALAGVRTEDYALHSLRIGSSTHLSTERATSEVLQREGQWASDAYRAYVRSQGEDPGWVGSVMAQEGTSNGIQPGQGTEWGQESKVPELRGKR